MNPLAATDRQIKGSDVTTLSWRRNLLVWLFLAVLAALLYGHTLGVPWYFDDHRNILENIPVRNLRASWWKVLFYDRGVAQLSFAVNFFFGGASPFGYHLVNTVIHVLAAGLVFQISRRIFRKGLLFPLLTAVLFLVHPLQTQAVTYVVQRMASMATLFMFLSLWAYIRGRERLAGGATWMDRRHLAWYATAIFALCLAILTKQIAAVLPLLLWLFDRYFLQPPARTRWTWKTQLLYLLPFFLIPALQAFLTFYPIATGHIEETGLSQTLPIQIRPIDYLFTQFSVIWLYIRLLFIPYPQMLDYNYPIVDRLLTGPNLVAFFGLLALGGWAFRVRRRVPLLSFGVFWFLLGLSVESTLIPLDTVFEHRLYLPMFGFAIFFWGLVRRFVPSRWVVVLAVTILLPLCVLTWERNALWNDPLAFNQDNLRRAGQPNKRTYLEVAKLLNKRGRFSEAEPILVKLIEDNPDYEKAYVNLSSTYMGQGRFKEAAALLDQALSKGFGSPKLLNNLGNLYSRTGRYREAVPIYRRALDVNKHQAETWTNLGSAFRKLGRMEEAEESYRRAILEKPEYPDAHFNLGATLFLQNRFTEAAREFEETVRQDPSHALAWLGVGATGIKLERPAQAEAALERLRNLDPRAAARLASQMK